MNPFSFTVRSLLVSMAPGLKGPGASARAIVASLASEDISAVSLPIVTSLSGRMRSVAQRL